MQYVAGYKIELWARGNPAIITRQRFDLDEGKPMPDYLSREFDAVRDELESIGYRRGTYMRQGDRVYCKFY